MYNLNSEQLPTEEFCYECIWRRFPRQSGLLPFYYSDQSHSQFCSSESLHMNRPFTRVQNLLYGNQKNLPQSGSKRRRGVPDIPGSSAKRLKESIASEQFFPDKKIFDTNTRQNKISFGENTRRLFSSIDIRSQNLFGYRWQFSGVARSISINVRNLNLYPSQYSTGKRKQAQGSSSITDYLGGPYLQIRNVNSGQSEVNANKYDPCLPQLTYSESETCRQPNRRIQQFGYGQHIDSTGRFTLHPVLCTDSTHCEPPNSSELVKMEIQRQSKPDEMKEEQNGNENDSSSYAVIPPSEPPESKSMPPHWMVASSKKIIYLVAAVYAGFCMVMFVSVSSLLQNKMTGGTAWAGFFANSEALVLALIISGFVPSKMPLLVALKGTPRCFPFAIREILLFGGGVLGAIEVLIVVSCSKYIGFGLCFIGVVCGQVVASVVIDSFGLAFSRRKCPNIFVIFSLAAVIIGAALYNLTAIISDPENDTLTPSSPDNAHISLALEFGGLIGSALGGSVGVLQSAFNGELGKRLGSGARATVYSLCTGLPVLLFVAFLLDGNPKFFGFTFPKDLLLLTGGIYSASAVFCNLFISARLGFVVYYSMMIGAQLAFSLIFDSFGAFGSQVMPADRYKILGVVLVLIGAVGSQALGGIEIRRKLLSSQNTKTCLDDEP